MLPGQKISVPFLLAALKRRWWMLLVPAVVGLFVGLIVSSKVRDTYQSEMLIQIVPQRVPDRFIPNTVTERTEDRMDVLEAQVKSRSQLEQLIREFGLYREQLGSAPMEAFVNRMRSAISVELLRPNRMAPPNAFYVRFTYDDPDAAAKVTARLGGIFVDKNAGERVKSAESTSEFLSAQLADSKAKLEAHEQKMEQFRLRHAGRLPSQADFNLQAMQTTQSSLQAIIESAARDRDRKLMLERLYNDALNQPAPVTAGAIAQPATSQGAAAGSTLPLRQQLEVARGTLVALEARLTAEHPDLRRARRIVADLQQKVAAEQKSSESGAPPPVDADAVLTAEQAQRRDRLQQMRAEIESMGRQLAFKEAEERRLRGVIFDYQGKLESTPGIESEWVALTRDYDTLTASYRDLLQKTEDSKVAADLERRNVGEQFRVLDPARVPVRPLGPMRLQINGIGFALGLLLGVLVAALLELRDRSFRTEADVLDVLELPVLAVVPFVADDVYRRRRRRRQFALSAAAVGAVAGGAYVGWSMQLWRYIS